MERITKKLLMQMYLTRLRYRLLAVDQWHLTEPKETLAERSFYFEQLSVKAQGCLIS